MFGHKDFPVKPLSDQGWKRNNLSFLSENLLVPIVVFKSDMRIYASETMNSSCLD